jgi:hypothetical protein
MLTKLNEVQDQLFNINVRPTNLFIYALGILIVNGYLFHYMEQIFFPNYVHTGPFTQNESRLFIFVVSCVIAPLLETYLFQVLPYTLLNKVGVRNNYLLLFLSPIVFGLYHNYNPLYQVGTFVSGLILNYSYIFYKLNFKHAFFIIALLHSAYNLYGFLFV